MAGLLDHLAQPLPLGGSHLLLHGDVVPRLVPDEDGKILRHSRASSSHPTNVTFCAFGVDRASS